MWSHTGRELFFTAGNSVMMVRVDPESGSHGLPERLFAEPNLVSWPYSSFFDIAPDDQSFVMVIRDEQQPATELRIVQNWFEELKRLCPTGK